MLSARFPLWQDPSADTRLAQHVVGSHVRGHPHYQGAHQTTVNAVTGLDEGAAAASSEAQAAGDEAAAAAANGAAAAAVGSVAPQMQQMTPQARRTWICFGCLYCLCRRPKYGDASVSGGV